MATKRIAKIVVTFDDGTREALTLDEIKQYMKPRIDWRRALERLKERRATVAKANAKRPRPKARALSEADHAEIRECLQERIRLGKSMRGVAKHLAARFGTSDNTMRQAIKVILHELELVRS